MDCVIETATETKFSLVYYTFYNAIIHVYQILPKENLDQFNETYL